MSKTQNSEKEHDINDIFDNILFTEDLLVEKGYGEGFSKGCEQGEAEGYRLGLAQGLLLGEELAGIFGLVIALEQQHNHTEKVKRCMEQLKSLIEIFPKENDFEADIIGSLEEIRSINKKLRILVRIKNTVLDSEVEEPKDLTF